VGLISSLGVSVVGTQHCCPTRCSRCAICEKMYVGKFLNVCFCFQNQHILKIYLVFKIIKLIFFKLFNDIFYVLILKIKKYFNIFLIKKYLSRYQTFQVHHSRWDRCKTLMNFFKKLLWVGIFCWWVWFKKNKILEVLVVMDQGILYMIRLLKKSMIKRVKDKILTQHI
jgi:hypothetical protein